MQRFFVKQGISVAICLTMAITLSAYSAACTISEQSIAVVSELSTRAAQSIEASAAEKFNTARGVAEGFIKTALADITLLKAEVAQAIVPEP